MSYPGHKLDETFGKVDEVAFDDLPFAWQQGEHVTLIGINGGGKTTLAKHLLPKRRFVVVVATKPRDPVVEDFQREGYRLMRHWPGSDSAIEHERVILWPKIETPGDVIAQRKIIAACLDDIYVSGAWCIYFDEGKYCAGLLRLEHRLNLLYEQARALKVSVVFGTQRPAWVPLNAYSQARHLFFFRTTDERDVARNAGIVGVNRVQLAREVVRLPGPPAHHDFLYANTMTGAMARSRIEGEQARSSA